MHVQVAAGDTLFFLMIYSETIVTLQIAAGNAGQEAGGKREAAAAGGAPAHQVQGLPVTGLSGIRHYPAPHQPEVCTSSVCLTTHVKH